MLNVYGKAKNIEMACQILDARVKALGPKVPKLNVYAVYSAQPIEMQTRIFKPAPHSEESGCGNQHCGGSSHNVVDPGFAKQSDYNPNLHLDSLVTTPIPQGSVTQRAGRGGRTEPDECYDCTQITLLGTRCYQETRN